MTTRFPVFASLSLLAAVFRLLLALGGLALLAMTLAGEFGATRAALDIINHFRPLILIAAFGVLVPAALMIRRGPGLVAVLVSAVVLVVQGRIVLPEHVRPPVALAASSASDAPTVVVASYNMLQHSTSATRLADWVRDEGIDVILLQEVGLGGRGAVAELARVLPHVHAPAGDVALLSRYPLSQLETMRRVDDKGMRTRPDVVAATVHPPGREPLRVVGVHFGWPEPARTGQAAQFDWLARDYLASASARTVLELGSGAWGERV